MIMLAVKGMLMGAVFPLMGFTEMPKAGPILQQPVQQSGRQVLQQPVQQMTQAQLSAIPPEFQLQMIRAMHARLGTTGRNVGPPFTGNIGELPGSTPQPGTTNRAHQHQQIPSGINLEMMQALMQRKQDG